MTQIETTTSAPSARRTPGPGSLATAIDSAVDRACRRVAPTWPLDRFIAVNPLWGHLDTPLPEAAARLAALGGARLLMPRAYYRDAWRAERFRRQDLEDAIAQSGAKTTADQLEALLVARGADPTPVRQRATVVDLVDATRDLSHEMSWRELVTDAISAHCATTFDGGQAKHGVRRFGSLYRSWRDAAATNLSPELLVGLGAYRELAAGLPIGRDSLIAVALTELDVEVGQLEAYLTALLLDVNGWAAWCAYRRWTAEQAGGRDDTIVDLLAIRLAWELLLYRSGGERLARRWQVAMAGWPRVDEAALAAQENDWIFQRALEIAYVRPLVAQLPAGRAAKRPTAPRAQVAFCIDVRSEVFRRALEAEDHGVQTLGFAGFFGMPVEYQPLGSSGARPQLPGLIAPKMRVTDQGVDDAVAARRARHLDLSEAWSRFRSSAVSGFSFVESVGLFYAGKLLSSSLGRGRPAPDPEHAGLRQVDDARRRPRLTHAADGAPIPLDDRVELAAGILRAMSISQQMAPLVALVGHGSQTVNNPHAAGYDCGACCGQAGDVNARAAAALLNDPEVRAGLGEKGVVVPEETWFVPGLHDTTTDRVTLFDLDEVPRARRADLSALEASLDAAGRRTRAERARALPGVNASAAPGEVARAVAHRARDWSEVRPEWGLSGNAAFVVAPREHVAHVDLRGRAFLHDYRWEEDGDGFPILELIMTAPMVVTHWINFQYYASTVDNRRFGSGNKVLHDVVGGHIGVLEGNGGDLRIGLPMQSIHDGTDWVHEPLRLNVFIEAPRGAIDAVIEKHEVVRHLVAHEWIHLLQIDPDTRAVWSRGRDGWTPAPTA